MKELLKEILLKDPNPLKHKLGRGIVAVVAATLASDAATKAYESIFKLEQF